MNTRILVVLGTSMFFSTISWAQEKLTGTITLHDVIRATIASNPQLNSYPLRQEVLLGQRETAGLKPAININASIENALGTGDLRGFNGAETTISLSKIVELGDKRSTRVGVINRRLELLQSEQKVAELDLLSEATFLFIALAAAQERVSLQTEAVEIAEQTLALLEPLVTAGQTPQLELSRANAALSRAKIAERYANSTLETAKIKLASMWGSQNPQYSAVNANFFSPGEPGSLSSLLLNLERNPYIAVFANEQRLGEAQLREAQTQQQNNIQWTAGIRHLQEINDAGLIFNISVPLFNKQRSSGAMRSAQASMNETEARRVAALNNMRGQLYVLYKQLEHSIFEVHVLQDDVLPLLTDVLNQTKQAYENGRYSYLELVSAQREYLDAELSLINTTANVHMLRAEIERLSGEALTEQYVEKLP